MGCLEMAKQDQTRPSRVSDRQSIVIEMLLIGATHQEAATEVGVARSTVTDWANHNFGFIAEHNVRRRSRLKASEDRLHSVVSKALALVEREIDDGSVSAAFAVLKLVGVSHLVASGLPGESSVLGVGIELAAKVETEQFTEMMTSSIAQEDVRRLSDGLSDI